MCEIKIPFKEYVAGVLMTLSGLIANLFYWSYEIFIRGESFYEDFSEDPLAHTLVVLMIPIMALIGYQFIHERRLRAELEEANRRLENSQRKLERVYRDLKEIDELKSNIIANVSHELRTPITIAKGFIELAMMEEDEKERENNLKSAIRALIRLNDTVEDLIQVANIERRDARLTREVIDLGELLEEAIDEKRGSAEERGVSITLNAEPGCTVSGDPPKLKRALLNILDNAIKFNRPGGKVVVKLEQKEDWVKVAVSDTGIGIPEDRLEDVFKPLTQLDPSPTRRYGGTGTGLAVAKRTIEAHGGRIWAESKRGEGTTFHILLPAHRAKAES